MRADECSPGGRLLAFGSGRQATAFEDVADGLSADVVAQMDEGASKTVIAPATILLGHLHHQVLQRLVDAGATQKLALVGAIELRGRELPVPAQNRLGFDDVGDFLQGLLAQFFADLGQGRPFRVCELYASLELVAQNAVFGYQILVAEQELLIDGPRDIGQQRFPIHTSFPLPCSLLTTLEYRSWSDKNKQETRVRRGVDKIL